MGRGAGFNFLEAGEEAGVVTESARYGVVRMAGLPIGKDDDAGAEEAQDARDFDSILEGVLDGAIGEFEGLAPSDAEKFCGFGGFGGAFVRCAAGTGLALGEIEDGGAQTARCHAQKGSATGLFDVVAVGGDGEDVSSGIESVGGHKAWLGSINLLAGDEVSLRG
jgi:hypothetical protein